MPKNEASALRSVEQNYLQRKSATQQAMIRITKFGSQKIKMFQSKKNIIAGRNPVIEALKNKHALDKNLLF
jgi:hypothetical protein